MDDTPVTTLPMPVNERDHVSGSRTAAVTLVMYGDYECRDCNKMQRTLEKLAAQLGDNLRRVYRHFPVINIHPQSLRAAEAAEAAAAQGKFWEMNSLLYSNPCNLDDKKLRQYAEQVGLDVERYDREMACGVHAPQIQRDLDYHLMHGVRDAPILFVNDEQWSNSRGDLCEVVTALASSVSIHK